ncbi:hypothetical protein HanLR1_Chr16g0622831 [Helianthus annuus]|nr:hypothetical protein HanLR1_Chr16g0622831 [Helianthus annuus]
MENIVGKKSKFIIKQHTMNKKERKYTRFRKYTLMPRGFATPRRNSTCAPSSCRVRSPTQTM